MDSELHPTSMHFCCGTIQRRRSTRDRVDMSDAYFPRETLTEAYFFLNEQKKFFIKK